MTVRFPDPEQVFIDARKVLRSQNASALAISKAVDDLSQSLDWKDQQMCRMVKSAMAFGQEPAEVIAMARKHAEPRFAPIKSQDDIDREHMVDFIEGAKDALEWFTFAALMLTGAVFILGMAFRYFE